MQLGAMPRRAGAALALAAALGGGCSPRGGERITIGIAPQPAHGLVFIANLLANVGQHAPGARVLVRVWRGQERVGVEVEDAGPGIPEDARERIFEAYEKLDGRRGEGLGLGLYIARQIVEAHGGSIRAEGGASDGACFTVELPARSPLGARPPREPPAGARRRSTAPEPS